MADRPLRDEANASEQKKRIRDRGGALAAPEYEVGYRKPPVHSQFKKGQPRPPRKAKPTVERSFEDWFNEELRVPMKFLDENGDEQVYPKGKVLAKAAVNKALRSGDIRQIKEFFPRRSVKKDEEITGADLETVARFFANHRGGALAELLNNHGDVGNDAAPSDGGDCEEDDERNFAAGRDADESGE